MIRVVIVEDEELARNLLKEYISKENDVQLIGEYADGFSAAVAINRDKPEVVLLDIQLPKINGFEMLEILEHTPQIIFSTAYDDYAIAAFEQNATDYLLKPFSQERFSTALQKARERLMLKDGSTKDFSQMANRLTDNLPMDRFVAKDSKGINILPVNDIHYIEAQDDYIMVYYRGGRHMKKQTMKSIESRLDNRTFVRVHRSYIINILEIVRVEPYQKDSFIAVLKSGAKVKVSYSGYKQLKEQLDF